MDSAVSLSKKHTATEMPSSPFMTLPFEIRTQIYGELLSPRLYRHTEDGQKDQDSEVCVIEEDEEYDWSDPYHAQDYHDDDGDLEDDESGDYPHEIQYAEDDEDFEELAYGEDIEPDDYDNYAFAADDDDAVLMRNQEKAGIHGHWVPNRSGFWIDPRIFRINKQIHDEVISVLYEKISCEIELTELSESIWIRQVFSYNDFGHRTYYRKTGHHVGGTEVACWDCTYRGPPLVPKAKDVMKISCLKSISYIAINHYPDQIDDALKDNPYLTPAGTVLLQILRCLNEEPASIADVTKKLHIRLFWYGYGKAVNSLLRQAQKSNPATGLMRTDGKGLNERLVELIMLLRSVRKSHIVILDEVGYERKEVREADLEIFEL